MILIMNYGDTSHRRENCEKKHQAERYSTITGIDKNGGNMHKCLTRLHICRIKHNVNSLIFV